MTTTNHKQVFWLSLLLAAATVALYWPATRYSFVALDDDQYVFDNPWVLRGLDWSTFKWAWTSTYAANWHPLTWLSHLLDISIYGTDSGGPHFTNILLHALNGWLLFLVLLRLTGAQWTSWIAAALFAWHPLRVESVAWVSERKDLLCGLFWMLTLGAYVRYVEERRAQSSKTRVYYGLALVYFALGLLSKPMIVTLPFVLVLLDEWPLQRPRALMEKWPFFVLAAASCAVTYMAQQNWGAIKSFAQAPLLLRVANVPVAYLTYIAKTLWPTDLCALYPLPARAPLVTAAVAAVVLAVITALAFRWRKQQPWIVAGWLWFLGTLVPVIGLVQVGGQAWADRYTYLPSIGLIIMVAWSVGYWIEHQPAARNFVGGAAFLCLLGCVFATERQLPYWDGSLPLFGRIVSFSPGCAGAQNGMGVALSVLGRKAEAVEHFKEALRAEPDSVHAHYNLGIELTGIGKLDEAMAQFDAALKLNPRSEQLHNNIGVVLAQQGKLPAALEQFQRAIELNPIYPKPYLNAARALEGLGRTNEAKTNYQKATQLDPSLRATEPTKP